MIELIERILIVVGVSSTVIYYVLRLRFLGSPRDVWSSLLNAVFPKSSLLVRAVMFLITVAVLFFVVLGGFIFADSSASSLTLLRVSVFCCMGIPILSWLVLGSVVLTARGKELAKLYRNTAYVASLPRPKVTMLNRPTFEAAFLAILVAYCIIEIKNQWQGFDAHLVAFLTLGLAFLYRLLALVLLAETKIYQNYALRRKEKFLFFFGYDRFEFSKIEILEDKDAIAFSDSNGELQRQIGLFEFSRNSVPRFVQMFGGNAS